MRFLNTTRFTGPVGAAVIGLLMVSVAAAAMLLAARAPSQSAEAAPIPRTYEASLNLAAKNVTTTRDQANRTTASKTPEAESASAAAAQDAAMTTITGCLEERKGQTFRLKDTTGLDAPKSRSWKSGFLKKGSPSIDLVDAANRAKLSSHVGQRVTVRGMLDDREMRVRSVQRVAASCD